MGAEWVQAEEEHEGDADSEESLADDRVRHDAANMCIRIHIYIYIYTVIGYTFVCNTYNMCTYMYTCAYHDT